MNRGKEFESKFREQWVKEIPDSFFLRLPDQMSGFHASTNISDFIAYRDGKLFLLECKSIKGNTFPVDNLTQYDKMSAESHKAGVRAGVVLWFIEHPATEVYVPISTFTKLKADGAKSFNVKMVGQPEYPNLPIPCKAKRVFNDSDYTVILGLPEGW